MAKSELFPRMPRVDYEPLDRRLRLTPEYYGKHTVVLGCMDVDGHGYLNPDTDARDYAKKFVKPGTVLKFNELTRTLDLQQMSRLYKPNTNVGGTDEITPAMAELQEQGATNISFMRLDMAFAQDKLTSKMRAVLQSTGLPPEEWITRMGFIKGSGGAWTAKAKLDPLTDYIPSKAYRAFVAQQLGADVTVAGQTFTGAIGGMDIDFTTEQAYKDPTDADMRYYAIGKALNNLIGEDFDLLVLGTSPAWMNPAKTWKNTGAYPARTGDEVDAGEVIETGAPTINNPNLSKIVLSPADYSFSSFDAIGYDQATITLGAPSGIHVGDELAISVGGYAISVKAVDASTEPNYALGEFRVGGTLTAEQIGEELEDAIMLWMKDIGEETLRSPVHAVAVGSVVTLTSLIPGDEGRIAIHVLTTGATGFTVASTKSTAILKVLDNTLVTTTSGSQVGDKGSYSMWSGGHPLAKISGYTNAGFTGDLIKCTLAGIAAIGIKFHKYGSTNPAHTNVRILNCDIEGSNVNQYGILVWRQIKHLEIRGCTVNLTNPGAFNPIGVYGDTTEFIVSDNHVYGRGHACIAMSQANNGIVANNYVDGSNLASEGGIEVEWKSGHGGVDTAHDIIVSNNIVKGANWGIYVTRRDTDAGYSDPYNITISGNQLQDCAYGVYLANGNKIMVYGNQYFYCDSDYYKAASGVTMAAFETRS